MSERERWIVYPLLFLALGAALRDKLIKQTTAEKVLCEELFADHVMCEDLYVRQGNQYVRVMKGNQLSIANVESARLTQGGQPILSLPQLLRALGWGVTKQPPQPPTREAPPRESAPPADPSPGQRTPAP